MSPHKRFYQGRPATVGLSNSIGVLAQVYPIAAAAGQAFGSVLCEAMVYS